jgi:hypothetical protein
MSVDIRKVAICACLAIAVAGTVATPAVFPQVFANEPQHQLLRTVKDMFPPPFDPRKLRKYDVVFADSVSTEALSTRTVNKVSFGQKSTVTIVTTATGTYSSDALTSPYVRYPGIDVTPKHGGRHFAFSSFTSRYGTGTFSSISAGSFTFYNSSFTPTKRR